MSRVFMVCSVLSVLLVSAALADEKTDADLKAINGKWQMTSIEVNGEKPPVPQGEESQAEFKDGKLFNKDGEMFAIKLDATVSPKLIDFTKLKDPEKDQVLEGIYKLEGDTLTICLWIGMGAKSRPADFEARPGSNFVLVTMKKQ